MLKTTANDGVKLAYRKTGSAGTAVMLIHGWMVSGAVYNDLMEPLGSEGLRILTPDLRGSGESDRPASGYTIERYARDVLAVADAEKVEKFVAVGHSMGGQIAQWLAAHHPDRVAGMVLLCTVPASGMQLPPEAVELFSNSGGRPDLQRTILTMATKQLSSDSMERLLGDAASIPAGCIREGFDNWRQAAFADKLGAVRARTLVVATDDPFLPPDFLQAQVVSKIARARLAVLPGPGHYVQVERPRETAALLNSFFAAMGD